uniref:Ig-like domain-containing protein n=1 Tax=Pelusios castaneus TaxID=367368 RepID=A0A8C8SBB9_9SAUR
HSSPRAPETLGLALHGTHGALQVSVPHSMVQSRPGCNVLLGCNFSVAEESVSLSHLVVQWKLGEHLVAEYDDTLSYGREGARLSEEGLRHGNASLLLPRVGHADAGLYTCSVIYTPNQQSGAVTLHVEGNYVRDPGNRGLGSEPVSASCQLSGPGSKGRVRSSGSMVKPDTLGLEILGRFWQGQNKQLLEQLTLGSLELLKTGHLPTAMLCHSARCAGLEAGMTARSMYLRGRTR